MNYVKKVWSDFRGISKACGLATALRWLGCIALTIPSMVRERGLSRADLLMGEGPFTVRYKGTKARLCGTRVFGSIREIWVRDVYGHGDLLKLPENALVVDLGSNIGAFTTLALATNPTARVVAVEPHRDFPKTMVAAARLNGFADRIDQCQAFIGDFTHLQQSDSLTEGYSQAPQISEAEFIRRFGIDRIDFLKCDIEGSEFAFLHPDSRLLDLSDRVAIELHGWGGDSRAFLGKLEEKGFRIVHEDWNGPDCIALATR
jgi:FkbM family methyltransferase